MEKLEDPRRYSPTSADDLARKMTPTGLDPRGRGALRELVRWREDEAARRDLPRSWVLKDGAIVDLARRLPGSPRALRSVRSVAQRRELESRIDELLACIRRGAEEPLERPPGGPRVRGEPGAEGTARLLGAWVRARAAEIGVSAGLLATSSDLETLVADLVAGREPGGRVLQGWRRDQIGEDLLRILSGRAALRVDEGARGIGLVELPD